MKRKIQIHDYVFIVEIADDTSKTISTSSFHMVGRKPSDFTEEEFKQGQIYQRDVFAGKWNWLIAKEGIITLSTHNILITVLDATWDGTVKYGGGTITSSLRETCPHCKDTDCDFDCPEAFGWASSADVEDCLDNNEQLKSQSKYNSACDAIEAMVLGHAIAGVNVEGAVYLEGLESAIDAVANNI
jgi:hypothetical protein